jgi:magnesium-transporting ATPase (P-type)
MATLHGGGAGRLIYKKGAAERLIERCTTALDDHGGLVPFDKSQAGEAVEHMAAKGLRVLAFARRHAASERLEHDHVAGDLTFLGFQGMIDPPRSEAIVAVRRCRSAGIRVKMITGDHLATAQAIASQIGLDNSPEPPTVSGRELERHQAMRLPTLRSARRYLRASRLSRNCYSCGRSSRAAMWWR